MAYIIVGLGNPGDEYHKTRHNIGMRAVEAFCIREKLPACVENKKYKSLTAHGVVGKERVHIVLPQTFMNKSGQAVATVVQSKKAAQKLIVVHDDLDLPQGTLKISYGRSSGGHRGVESVIRAIKTKDFIRVRIGTAPTTPGGKLRKPQSEKAVVDFVIGVFSKKEEEIAKKILQKASEVIATIVTEGKDVAMNEFN